MSRQPLLWTTAVDIWLRYWFAFPALNTWALLRIGVSLVVFYSLFVYSFDLESHLVQGNWAELGALQAIDPIAWRYSIFEWVDGRWWLWTVHLVALGLAAALVLGVLPILSGPLLLLCYLSYGHRNPAVMVPLDDLIVIALIYISISPCAYVLTVVPWRKWLVAMRPQPRTPNKPEPRPFGWGGFLLRLLQIQLCLLYFLSALGSLFPEWLAGEILLHPRLLERGLPVNAEVLLTSPVLSIAIAQSLTLFSLFYTVLVWLPRFRYPVVATMIVMHLVVGSHWGQQAHNMLMVVLNLSFLNSDHLSWLGRGSLRLVEALWRPLVQRP